MSKHDHTPHLPRRKDIAELATTEGVVQVVVRLTAHIGRSVGMEVASDDVKLFLGSGDAVAT